MRKQNNFRLSKTKNNILYALSGATLALFAGLMLFPTITETTHAEGDEPDDGITITVNGEVDANLVLFDEGDYKIAKDTVSVSSSAAYGYELFLTTDSETHQSIYLNDDPTSESRIAPVSGTIAEPATLTNNTWGFAIAEQGNFDNEYDPANPDPASRFAIIPTVDDQQAVFENNAATAEDSIDFYYGIKVEPTLEPGEYKTSAEYTAIAKEPPLTAKAILGENGNLNFVYDRGRYVIGNTYTDNLGETTIINVFDVPLNSDYQNKPAWINSDNMFSANFSQSFFSFMPTSTAYWFSSECNGSCNKPGISTLTNIKNLNTNITTNMNQMFFYGGGNSDTYELDLGDLDTSSVENMRLMFAYAGRSASTWKITGLKSWDISNVLDMTAMFEYTGQNSDVFDIDLSGWNFGEKQNAHLAFDGMFLGAGTSAGTFEPNLSNWTFAKSGSITFEEMFRGAAQNTPSYNPNLSNWSFASSSSISFYNMFYNSGGRRPGQTFTPNVSNWTFSGPSRIKMVSMFERAGLESQIFNPNFENLTIIQEQGRGNVEMNRMFYEAGKGRANGSTIFEMDLSGWQLNNVRTMSEMFRLSGYYAQSWGVGDISDWNVQPAGDFSYMFYEAGQYSTEWEFYGFLSRKWRTYGARTNFIILNFTKSNQESVNWGL